MSGRRDALNPRPDVADPVVEVLDPGLSTTVQDLGRTAHAALGVPTAGALDHTAMRTANARLANPEGAPVLEVTLGGLRLRALRDVVLCVTGAVGPAVPVGEPFVLRAGEVVSLGSPAQGMRAYVAVAGGWQVPETLGSCSWDSLSRLGPPPLRTGDRLARRSGGRSDAPVASALDAVGALGGVRAVGEPVRVWPGPRADWFASALDHLCGHVWTVTPQSDRVGLRLDGEPLGRVRAGELASEPLLIGAVQVPHDGCPIVMLADHPTTGGYPVVAVVDRADLDALGQVRPGEIVRFVRSHAPSRRSGAALG